MNPSNWIASLVFALVALLAPTAVVSAQEQLPPQPAPTLDPWNDESPVAAPACADCPPPIVYPRHFASLPPCTEGGIAHGGCWPNKAGYDPPATWIPAPGGEGNPSEQPGGSFFCWKAHIDGFTPAPGSIEVSECMDSQTHSCQGGYVTLPCRDTDGDGEPYLTDPDEDKTPFQPDDHPLNDSDGDGLVNGHDALPLGDGRVDKFKNGFVQYDLCQGNGQGLKGLLQRLGVDPDVAADIPCKDSYVDYNNDGRLLVSEVLTGQVDLANELADALNQTSSAHDALQYSENLAAAADAALILYNGICDGNCNPDFVKNLENMRTTALEYAEALRYRIGFIDAGLEVLGLGGSDYTATIVTGQDGTASIKCTRVDKDGNVIDLGDELAGLGRPSHRTGESTAGDPVDTATGGFVHRTTDLALLGRGMNVNFERVYQSRSTKIGALGRNWSMPLLDTYLVLLRDHETDQRFILSHWGDGTSTLFHEVQTGDPQEIRYYGDQGEFGLIRNDREWNDNQPAGCELDERLGGFVLRRPDGTEYHYCPPSWMAGAGTSMVCWLRQVSDSSGNAITLKRNDRALVYEIVDTMGRQILLEHNDLDLLTQIQDWEGRKLNYSYDLGKRELTRVDYPSTAHLSAAGVLSHQRPFEIYTYWEHPLGFSVLPEPFLNHNLKTIERANGPVIYLEYYQSPGIRFDKVSSHTVDGKVTTFDYTVFDPSNPDPIDSRIKFATTMTLPDGERERYLHEGGRLYRKEVLNGRFSAGGGLIPGSNVPNGPSAWWTIHNYNDEDQITSILETTDAHYPNGRRVELAYDTANPVRLSQGNLIQQTSFPDPTVSGTTPSSSSVSMVYEPVTNRVVRVVDNIGRISETVYGHQEREYDAVRGLPELSVWNFLPLIPQDAALWNLGDVNQDGRRGGTFQPIAEFQPTVTLADPAGPNGPNQDPAYRAKTRRAYDPLGQLKWVIDPRGFRTNFLYEWGQIVKITRDPQGLNAQTIYDRDDFGRVIEETEPDGTVHKYKYDSRDNRVESRQLGRQVAALPGQGALPTDGAAIVASCYYDLEGRKVGESLPRYSATLGSTYTLGQQPVLDYKWTFSPAGALVQFETRTRRESLTGPMAWNEVAGPVATWLVQYDGRDNMRLVSTPAGATIELRRDPRGLVIARERWVANTPYGVSRFEYDDYGGLVKSISPVDADGNGTSDFQTTTFDGYGRELTHTDPTGLITRLSYDIAGRVISATQERNGVVVGESQFLHDGLDRITFQRSRNLAIELDGTATQLLPEWLEQSFGYGRERAELLWEMVDPNGLARITRFQYDSAGRRKSTLFGIAGDVARFENFDVMGRVLSRTERFDSEGRAGPISPSESTWLYEYDGFGRVRRITDPTGRSTLLAHSAAGAVRSRVDGLGSKSLLLYDSQGNCVLEAEYGFDGTTRTTSTAYDVSGNVVSVTDGNGSSTVFEYDELERQTLRKIGGVDEIRSFYDNSDALTHLEYGPSHYVDYTYTTDGKLKSVVAVGADAAVQQNWTYSATGQLQSVVDTVAGVAPVTVLMRYRSDGRLVSEEQLGVSGGSRRFDVVHDSAGDWSDLVYPSGDAIHRTPDALGRTSSIAHTRAGALFSVAQPYGLTRARRIDLSGSIRWESDFDAAQRTTRAEAVSGAGTVHVGSTFSYDAIGDIASRTSSLNGTVEEFDYDGLDRLKEWRFGVANGVASRTVTWTRDNADNALAVADTIGGGGSFAPNSLNQYLSSPSASAYSYNVKGQEQSRSEGTSTWQWTWDALGRPLSATVTPQVGAATSVTWKHDGLGRMVARTDSAGHQIAYAYLQGAMLREDDSSLGNAEYVLRPDSGRLGWRSSTQRGDSYIYIDPLNNVEALHSPSSVTSRFRYDPFGTPRDFSTGNEISGFVASNSLLFQGMPFDPLLGMSRLGARLYDPGIGRFVSRDPLKEAGGLNLYDYAYSNPMRFGDPTGLKGDAHQPGTPIKPAGVTVSASGVISGNTLGVLNKYIEIHHDSLGVAKGSRFEDLSPADQVSVLTSALNDTSDLMDLHENTKNSPILAKAVGAPTAGEFASLQAGQKALVGAMANVAKNVLEAVIDLPATVTTAGLTQLGVDHETASDVGAAVNTGIDVLTLGKGGAKIGFAAVGMIVDGRSVSKGAAAVRRVVKGLTKAASGGTRTLPSALRGGDATTHVYFGTRNGERIYVGITNDVVRRQAEHGGRFVLEGITQSPVTRGEARAIEQALINRNPGFENIRNSISPNHSWYGEAAAWGEDWLKRAGY